MNATTRATLIGFAAIALWSSNIGLIKEVSIAFGPVGGSALIYSVAGLILLFSVGWVPLRKFPKKYLFWGGITMVSYEICLALSIGYSQNSRQAIEVGMVNYLWPTFTMVATVVFHTKYSNWLIIPGVCLAMIGLVWVLAGDTGFNISQMMANIESNPLSYGLAFIGACLWAAYCVVTIKLAQGVNGITLFFLLVGLVLWIKYFLLGEAHVMVFSPYTLMCLVASALVMGFGYAAWNVGIMKGNVTLLTGASYFIPVMSSALSSIMLSTPLGLSFWQGSLMVCAGSVLCWLSSRRPVK